MAIVAQQFLEGFAESFTTTMERRRKKELAEEKARAAAFKKAVTKAQKETDTRVDKVKIADAVAAETGYGENNTVKNYLYNQAINLDVKDGLKLQENLINAIKSGVLDPSADSQIGDISINVDKNVGKKLDLPPGVNVNDAGLVTFPGQEGQSTFNFFGDKSDIPIAFEFKGDEGEAVPVKTITEALAESGAVDTKAFFKPEPLPVFKNLNEFEQWRTAKVADGSITKEGETFDYNPKGLFNDGYADSITIVENLLKEQKFDEKYKNIFDLSSLDLGTLKQETFEVVLGIAEAQANGETATNKQKILDRIEDLRKSFLNTLPRNKVYMFEDSSKWNSKNIANVRSELEQLSNDDFKKLGYANKNIILKSITKFEAITSANDTSSIEGLLKFNTDDNPDYMQAVIDKANKISNNSNLSPLNKNNLDTLITLAEVKMLRINAEREEEEENLIQKNSAESWANDPFNTSKLATIDGKDAEDLLAALEVEIRSNNNNYLNSVGNQKKEFSVRNANLLTAQAFLKDKIEAYNLEQVGSEDMVLDNLQLNKLSELTSDQLLGNIQIIRKRLKSIQPVEGGLFNENQIKNRTKLLQAYEEIIGQYELKLNTNAELNNKIKETNVKFGDANYGGMLESLMQDNQERITELVEQRQFDPVSGTYIYDDKTKEIEYNSLVAQQETLQRKINSTKKPGERKIVYLSTTQQVGEGFVSVTDVSKPYTYDGVNYYDATGQELSSTELESITSTGSIFVGTDRVMEIEEKYAKPFKEFTTARLQSSKQLRYLATAFNIIDQNPGANNSILKAGKSIANVYQDVLSAGKFIAAKMAEGNDPNSDTPRKYTYQEAIGIVESLYDATSGSRELAFVALGIAYGVAGERGSEGMALSDRELNKTIESLALGKGNPEEAKYIIASRVKEIVANDAERLNNIQASFFIKRGGENSPFIGDNMIDYMTKTYSQDTILKETLETTMGMGKYKTYDNNFDQVIKKMEEVDPTYNKDTINEFIDEMNEKFPNASIRDKNLTLNTFLGGDPKKGKGLGLKLKKAVTLAEIERFNQLLNDDDLTNDGVARDDFYQRIGMDGEFFRRRGD